MRYPLQHGFAVILLLLLVMSKPSQIAAAQLTPFKIGISEAVNTVLPIWMAEAAGFYTAQGLKVEIINMQGGSRGAQELQAGHIDAMHVGLSSVLRLNRAGGDLRTVASVSNEVRFTFFVNPKVKSASDLRSAVIGVSTFGSESDATVTLALQQLGLRREDVILKEYGGGIRRLEAITTGEIKGTAVNEPATSIAHKQGLKVMVDLAAKHIPWLFSGIVVKQSYLAAHRNLVVQFIKATMEGNCLALSNQKLAKEVLSRETKVADPKILDVTYKDFKLQTPANLEPARRAAENVIAHDPAGGSAKLEDYVDTGIIEELKREGFVAALQRKYKR